MMKQHLRLGAAMMLGMGLFIASCSKDDDSGPSATPNELKLESHAWNVSAATQTDSVVTDSSILSACMQDDSLVFGSNRQYLYADGATVCDSTVLPYGKGNWVLNTTEDTLVLKSASATWNFKVNTLTDSTLQLTLTDSVNSKAITRKFDFETK